jgi:hypothetical protein
MTDPYAPAPVEKKVTAATFASYLGGVALLAILNGVADTNLITALPDVVEVFVAPLVPTAITFIGGYVARHTPRNDTQV